MPHGFVDLSDRDLFCYYNAHVLRLALLTRLSLGAVGMYFFCRVVDITPFSALPFQRTSMLDLAQVVDRNTEILSDLLRSHFILYQGATSSRTAGLLFIERATLAILSPTISIELLDSPLLSV